MSRRARIVLVSIALVILGLIAQDLFMSHRSVLSRGAIAAIDVYRARISPRLRGTVTCRFQPSCSAFGRVSVIKYGAIAGGARSLWRIARCGPWTTMGTVDLP